MTTRPPRTPSEVRALMRDAPEMLASAKIPDRVQRLVERFEYVMPPRAPHWMDAFDNLTFDRDLGLWLPVKLLVALSVAIFGWLR
jgi:hypothetical protein